MIYFLIKFLFLNKTIIQINAIRLIITPTLYPIVNKPIPNKTININKIFKNIFN